jgi:hypothetical protein
MKLTNLLGQTNRSFASVFLAFSLFGFLFPHHNGQVTPNHQVHLSMSRPAATEQTENSAPDYEWFY